MPIGKDIYTQMSKKSGERKKRIEDIVSKRMKSGNSPIEPPKISQSKKNLTARTSSNSMHILELAGAGPRKISPNEGMPAVNGKSGDELVAKAVTKVLPKIKTMDPTAGAIKPTDTKKKEKSTSRKKSGRRCSSCNKVGHTKATCSSKS